MTITIELTPDLDRRLREAANRQGQEMSAFARILLAESLGSDPRESLEDEEEGETLDKTLAGHIGLIAVDSSSISEKPEDPFLSGLIEKYRKQGLTV